MSTIDLSTIPSKPGCYLYQDSRKNIIYVGKAKNLKKRVSQYFQKQHEDSKTQTLVKNIVKIDFIITDSEIEALLLESRLIKQYKPKFNIDLKENERYAYIKLTDEQYPRLVSARRKTGKGDYFGPFISGYNRVLTIKAVNQVFELKTCKGSSKQPCFNSYIGLCSCPQALGISQTEYSKRLTQVKKVLKGNTHQVIEQLQVEMNQFANSQQFEYAKIRRDQVQALESLQERQKVETNKEFDQDIIGHSFDGKKIGYFVFNIEQGTLKKRDQYTIDLPENMDLQEAHQQFIMQYYGKKVVPKRVIISQNFIAEKDLVQEALSKSSQYKVELFEPKIGDTKQLLDLASANADYLLAKEHPILIELKDKLKLPSLPVDIECYDISNLRDEYIVGAKVHFTNAQPNKNLYRKYRVRWTKTQNDFASMYEVLKRRLNHAIAGDEPLPNLIVIDGGRGQLNAALQAAKELHIKVPMIGLAKQEEEIYFPGLSKPLNTHNNKNREESIRLLMRIRDETHRFVINYHRKLRDTITDSD